MAAVIAVSKRKVHTFIISQIHRTADQRLDRAFVVAHRIADILDLSSIAQFPESSFQILFLDRGQVFRHMAVEAVAHIRTVGYVADNSVFFAELFHLKSAQGLCRSSVDCVQNAVFFFILVDLFVDIFQGIQRKLSVFRDGFSIVQFLQLVQRRNSKGCGHRLQQRTDLVGRLQIAAVETSLAVCQRVGGSTHFSEIIIRSLMEITDHFQIEIQDLMEITVLRTGFCQDHRQMQGNSSDIEASHKHRLILIIRRLHASALKPRAQERTASHRADHAAVLLVHAGDISFSAHGQPVRIHGLCGTVHARLKNILTDASWTVDRFVIQEYDLREKHRLFMAFFALSSLVYFQEGDGDHLLKHFGSKSQRHGDKRVVSAGRTYGIQFVFNTLPSLVTLAANLVHRVFHRFFFASFPGWIGVFQKLLYIMVIALLCVRRQDLIHLRHSKSAVLLCRRTQHDISHDVKCGIQALGLVIPYISHLKSAF